MTKLRKVIGNTLTNVKIVQAIPIDEEVHVYDNSVLITETDSRGIITYANRRFINLSGFTKEELLGSPHNITRHPDMPLGLFKAMWKIITSKKVWRGYVKSLRKDGKFYWTLTYIQAKIDNKGNIIGYTASRKMAYRKSIIEAEEKYSKLKGLQNMDDAYFMSSELYHGEQLATKY
ncbi:MAG TPA: PAS domain S-box protein [Epsilonproteobacteria bacterium]|nr:PAS domain S-box protein [Campylobacterota bacterium]